MVVVVIMTVVIVTVLIIMLVIVLMVVLTVVLVVVLMVVCHRSGLLHFGANGVAGLGIKFLHNLIEFVGLA